jgi:hypothetical protein
MVTQEMLDAYLAEIRERLCRHCIERPPGGPPCLPLGKRCGVESHLEELVAVAHAASSLSMEPYETRLQEDVCEYCSLRTTRDCPCPLLYLLPLAIEAVEAVDNRCAEAAGIA